MQTAGVDKHRVCRKVVFDVEGNITELVGGRVCVKTTIPNKMSQTEV